MKALKIATLCALVGTMAYGAGKADKPAPTPHAAKVEHVNELTKRENKYIAVTEVPGFPAWEYMSRFDNNMLFRFMTEAEVKDLEKQKDRYWVVRGEPLNKGCMVLYGTTPEDMAASRQQLKIAIVLTGNSSQTGFRHGPYNGFIVKDERIETGRKDSLENAICVDGTYFRLKPARR